ncbi:MAG TPA: FAD-dependent oxidoreductase, partial [Jatrophihabitantaceae bacterium]|nr:FAD-dependent oxidoreductase [Jatrophihabitantaceae bacterium]
WNAGAAPLDRFLLVIDDVRMDVSMDVRDFGLPGLCVRRVTLDAVLVGAAREVGVDVRTRTNVTGLIRDGGRVAGVETNAGPIRSRLVVGADGPHSRVAQLVGAEEYGVAAPGRLFAWGYYRGVPRDSTLRLQRVGERGFIATPTDGGLYLAGVVPQLEYKAEFMADREAYYAADVEAMPELAELLDGAEREGPLRVVSSWHGYFRRSAGPGWALVGDAGQFKDPTPGQGIGDALRQAHRMADMIATTYTDQLALDDALQRWWQWRDRDAREMHWFAADLGAPGEVLPLRRWMMGDLASTPATAMSFIRVMNHDIPPSKVMTGRRLARAVVEVGRSRAVPLRDVAREAAGLVRDNVKRARLDGPKPVVRRARRPSAVNASASERAVASASRS